MEQRVIKFRAWDIGTQTWIYFGVDGIPASRADRIDNGLIHQFTGLLDKDGNEIYEGDIVLVNYSGHWMQETVIFEFGAFKKMYSEQSGEVHRLHFTSLSPKYTQVIGNVFQTPELLQP